MIRNILLGVLVLLSACDMNIPLEDEISGKDAIDNVDIAREALNAAYFNYPKENITFSILSDDLQPTYLISRNSEIKKLYEWDGVEINKVSTNIWKSYYHVIAQINTVLKSEENIKFRDNTETKDWERLKGEAYALKAMSYFELLKIYSGKYNEEENALGIVLKDEIELEFQERKSIKKTILEITNLLSKASKLLKGKASLNNYMNYYSVVLLQARLMQYKGEDTNAITYSEEIINNIGYSDETVDKGRYKQLWGESKHQEKIFTLDNYAFLLTYIIDDLKTGDILKVNDKIEYAVGDVRREVAYIPFKMKQNGTSVLVVENLLGKYRNAIDDRTPKDINILRLSEAYFIAGESYSRTKEFKKARDIVNIVLRKRGAEEIDNTIVENELTKRILKEKYKEFVGEGLRYFDMKRIGIEAERYNSNTNNIFKTISTDDYRWLFPIPKQELRQNKNIKPNPGWEKIIK